MGEILHRHPLRGEEGEEVRCRIYGGVVIIRRCTGSVGNTLTLAVSDTSASACMVPTPTFMTISEEISVAILAQGVSYRAQGLPEQERRYSFTL